MKKKDKIEQFFTSRLSSDKPADNGWNVAPTELLDNVFGEMDADSKRKKRRGFFLLLFLGLFLMIGGISFYAHHRINQLSDQVSQIDKNILTNQNNFQSNQNTNAQNANNTVAENKNEVAENNDPSNAIISRESTNNNQEVNGSENRNGTIQEVSNQQMSNATSNSIQPPIEESSQAVLLGAESQNQIVIATDTSAIEHNTMSIVDNRTDLIDEVLLTPLVFLPIEEVEKVYPEPLQITNDSEEKHISLYFQLGPNLSSYRMTNIGEPSFDLTQYDAYYLGSQIELGIRKPISQKLSAVVSASFISYKNHSFYKEEMVYDESKEDVNDVGQKVYNTSLTTSSPISQSTSSAKILMEGNDMKSDDIMEHTSEIEQRFESARLKLGLQYNLLERNQWQWSAGVNLSGFFILRMQENMSSKLCFQDKWEHEFSKELSKFNQVNRFYLSPSVETMIQYSLQSNIQIGFGASYETSINSIRSTIENTNPKTYLQTFQAGLRLQYSF